MAELKITLVNGELAGKTMQDINKQVREAQKELSKAKIGTEEFVKAQQKLENAKGLQEDLAKQIKGTTNASNMLKEAWNKFPLAGIFNDAAASVGMMKQGVGGLVSQFGVLKTAIAATGVGALVIVVGSLINYFSKLESVTNILKGAWDGLTAAFNVFTKAVATLDFENFGDNIATAASEAYNLVDAFDQLEDKARDLDLSNSEAGKTIDQLLLKSKNVSLSYEERLAILDQVSAVENEQHKKRLEYANEYLATVEREVANAELQNEANDELKDKLVAAKKAVIEADRETLVLQEKIENRRSQLLEKQQAEIDRANAKREADAAKELARKEKEYQEYLKLQAEFDARMAEQEEKQATMREARKIAEAKAEKQRILDGMLAAADALQKRVEAEQKAADEIKIIEEAKANMKQAELALFNEGVNSIIALLAADQEARKKNAAAIKTFTIGQIAVNLQDEIQGIWSTANKNAANVLFPGAGNIIAGLKTGFAVARAAAATRRVLSQKFELGGPVNGPSHAGGGVPIEAEGGEFIFSRKAVQAIGMPVLDAINKRMTFANGGPVNPYGTSTSSAQASALIDYAKLAGLIDQAMDRKLMRLQVVNNVGDTEKGIKVLNQIRNEADV